MKTAVALVSGGLDSSTLLFELVSQGYSVKAVTFDYGQRHKREIEAAMSICSKVSVPHKIIDISSLKPIFGESSLTSAKPVPHGHYTDESMKSTVVPNRNMIFLSIAAAYAIASSISSIAYAAHAGDHTIYPDCRPEFGDAMGKAFSLCDWSTVNLIRPFVNLTKDKIVERGAKLGVPFELTWSCYEGGKMHCGKCGTCVERKEAFALANVADPTRYD